MLLRARVVVPVSQPPIENGAIAISRNRIQAVGTWPAVARQFGGPVHDLGNQILLPGLVNAHCHLDYTSMAGLFSQPRRFTDWIKLITTAKASWSDDEFAESWQQGADMLLRNGTTTVGDIEALPALLPDVWDRTPLRVFSFLEMTGIRSRRQPAAVLNETLAHIKRLDHRRCKAWLSPHAPYSTLPELLKLATATARRRRWRVSTHVAESDQEFEMFMHGQGEMHDWLERNDRNNSDCGLGSPVQHLARHGALSAALLAIHVNYLAPGDAELLARHHVHVVHCPRSHAYFRHQAFPYEALSGGGTNISLATDSLASVTRSGRQRLELNLFDEMRMFSRRFPAVSPEVILRMVTANPALALGQQGRLGTLSAGASADVIAIPLPGREYDSLETILHHSGPVSASMIAGLWAMAPSE
jgi:cytosine/adenosine deaminase-related metal-dependent hydrolase